MSTETQKRTTLVLNPEEQTRNPLLDDIPVMQSVVSSGEPKGYSAGTIDESMLSEEEREMVDQFAEEIDITNVDQVVKYGMTAQQNISDFSVSILKKVKTYDLGEVGTSLKELTTAVDATTEPEKKGIFGVFQKAKRGVGTIRANYAKAESNVDRIEKDLRLHQNVLIQDISMYQQMYELNVQYYKELTMYIIAGKKALDKAKNGKLVELKAKADQTNLQEDVQEYKDFEDLCYRFEKKISDLELTRVIAIQSAPQVRMLQNNDREMLDKLQSSLSNTIPLWRNQLVLSLGIEHSQRALEAQSVLTEKTNDLLRRNSETLKMATIETAKEVEKPIVDIETLRLCSKNLISSVNEVVKIHEQGTAKRAKAQEELLKIEEELKQAMLEPKYRK
ncbi:toxic anion resistance protein [Dorea sp. YH-dor228]|uniref:toxic anion resistance protein n=1 Tax=Dorea sp. YH-dor228 TaxID=3151120 RepID=UPI003242C867